MKNVIVIIFIFFQGCKIATQLSKEKVTSNLIIRYALFYNNRTINKKPSFIYVSVDSSNSKIRNHNAYLFYLNSNKVEKINNYRGEVKKYTLISDSTNNNADLLSVSIFEAQIFEKVIYLADSMRLKDFNFLNQSKIFSLIPKK